MTTHDTMEFLVNSNGVQLTDIACIGLDLDRQMPLPEIKLGTLSWPVCPPKARVSPWGHKSIVLLFFLLLGNRFLSQQNESRIAMTDTTTDEAAARPSVLTGRHIWSVKTSS